MGNRTITIETNTLKKGKLDRRTFTCQLLEFENLLVYVLDDTKNQLTRKRFTLECGCRLYDGDSKYVIQDINYLGMTAHPYLTVSRSVTF